MAGHETTILPPRDEAAFHALVDQLRSGGPVPRLTLSDGTTIDLPDEIAEALRRIVGALALGQAVTVAPQHTTLTTQQAADLLGVSRPTLVKLLDDGALPHTRPGRHRRVHLTDVLAYRDTIRRDSHAALDELAAISDEAGLYEDTATPRRTR
ncbi:MAG TPA: helix-turn-helix domain-containing protein [Nitriliruptorales bacterium]